MSKNIFILIGVMIAIGLISAVLTYVRSEKMSLPAEIAFKGPAETQKGNVVFFGLFVPILIGTIAYYVYRSLVARSPDIAQTICLFLAVGIGIVFTILAAPLFDIRVFVEFTALRVFYVAGFGWVMPKLLIM